jgi:hypothetical protein
LPEDSFLLTDPSDHHLLWFTVAALSLTDFLPAAGAWSIPGPLNSLRSRVGEDKPPFIAGSMETVPRDRNHEPKEMMMTTETNHQKETRLPTYHAYHVIPGKHRTQKDRWNRVGVFFAHDDGQGGTLVLDSIPIAFDGRIVLRAPKTDQGEGR